MLGGTQAAVIAAGAAVALSGCATRGEGPVIEPGGAPMAGLAESSSTPQGPPEDEDHGLLAASGTALLTRPGQSPTAADLLGAAAPSPAAATSLTAGSPLATGSASLVGARVQAGQPGTALTLDVQPTPLLALNGQPAPLLGVSATLSPTTGSLGVRTPLGPAQVTAPAVSTTQLANAVVSATARSTASLAPPTLPGPTTLTRILSTLTNPLIGP